MGCNHYIIIRVARHNIFSPIDCGGSGVKLQNQYQPFHPAGFKRAVVIVYFPRLKGHHTWESGGGEITVMGNRMANGKACPASFRSYRSGVVVSNGRGPGDICLFKNTHAFGRTFNLRRIRGVPCDHVAGLDYVPQIIHLIAVGQPAIPLVKHLPPDSATN